MKPATSTSSLLGRLSLPNLLVLGGTTILALVSPVLAEPSATEPSATNPWATQILDSHNQYRQELNVPLLTWSDTLASDAQRWADRLAAMGGRTLQHSSFSQRDNQGENLRLGTANAFSPQAMVQGWGSEQHDFVNGIFPDVSRTGNWADVGHYTQIVWRETTEVGCAIAQAEGNDILVCRYSPAGNFMGEPVY